MLTSTIDPKTETKTEINPKINPFVTPTIDPKTKIKNVIDMSGMFAQCSKLIEIDSLENFNTKSVKSMSRMFLCVKI